MGVTYSAMLAAAEATGDQAYYKYVTDRFSFWPRLLHTSVKYWKVWNCRSADETNLTPHALDDAGAVCAAMVKVQMKKIHRNLSR